MVEISYETDPIIVEIFAEIHYKTDHIIAEIIAANKFQTSGKLLLAYIYIYK